MEIKISGPVEINIFRKHKQLFVFLSDNHSTRNETCDCVCNRYDLLLNQVKEKSNCYTILALLDTWFKMNNQQDIKTDFYIESEIIPHPNMKEPRVLDMINELKKNGDNETLWKHLNKFYEMTSFLRLLRLFFNDVLQDKSNIYQPNVQLHPVDIRSIRTETDQESSSIEPFTIFRYVKINDNAISFMNFLLDNVHFFTDFYFEAQEYKIFKQNINNLMNDNDIDMDNDLEREFYSSVDDVVLVTVGNKRIHKISYELSRLSHNLRKMLKKFIYNRLDEVVIKTRREIPEVVNFVELGSLIMDAYLLALILNNHEAEQIIVYAGYRHIDNYVEFLKDFMNYKLVEHNTGKQDEGRCVYSEYLYDLIIT